ncbi:serine/threonine-protein kinase [Allocatelliglobosispora scoriae]|uniref:non-specific serine/threonine protein kinase n=1 Tax=Allocatelliglobosispora scoriae TaxID=643052 RepID=A0A841BRJ3_9ACTN|nr:Stk1 family PASTA domain-containing Ser/Thr kinase [Allocatelliglobosispora scoriae]MBB5869421.1 serine/threonine-protein kinase [Allocatelliglobosispora scoriae]
MDTQVADPLLGSLVDGRYRVRSRVARGGMATVYTAVDERLERTVALKIIHSGQRHAAAHPMSIERFTDEAKTIARLVHPNVVAVYDTGLHLGTPYLVMEYVRGHTLRDILSERRRLSPRDALAVLEQMLAAIAAAHRAGLVHRDVKPENVLIAEAPGGNGQLVDAVVKVADFGLARAVEASADDPAGGQLMATVAYVAPELVTDGHADPRTDVYAAGIVLFEMLTGRVPYEGDRPVDVAWQHVDLDVPPPSKFVPGLPPVLDRLVARATRRDPGSRPTDAGAFLAEVQLVREELNTTAMRAGPAAQPTVVVDQIVPTDRPSWARLPSPGPAAAPRSRRASAPVAEVEEEDVTLIDQARLGLRRLQSTERGRMVLTAALVVLTLLVLTGGWWFLFGRYEAAPQLAGKTRVEAEQLAKTAGFTLIIGTGQFREDVKKDIVLTQDPPAGDRAVKGSAITLILSLGPERYLVPDVIGRSWDLAVVDIQDRKLVPVKGTGKYSDTVAKDVVLEVNPPVDTQLKPGDKVTVILSKGRAPITVPNVVGTHRDQATAKLQELGLIVAYIEQPSDKPGGEVLTQDPVGGAGVEAGTKITLTVAQGPPGVVMPRVLDMNCRQATDQLRGMGLDVEVDGNVIEQNFGTVKEQRPDEGKLLKQGEKVRIKCK